MCIKNLRFRDKKPLSQKLIVRNSRFRDFGTAKLCVITDVYGTGLTIAAVLTLGGKVSNNNQEEGFMVFEP